MKKDALLQEFISLVDIEGFNENYSQDIGNGKYFGMPLEPIIAAEKRLRDANERCIAYFSMEYGLATSFYNSFKSQNPIDLQNKIPENTAFSNYRLADYFFDVKIDNIIDLPIYSGGLGVLAGDTVKTMADYKLPAVGVGILWHFGYFRQRFWFKYGQIPEKMYWNSNKYPGLIPLKNTVTIKIKNSEIVLRLWKYYVYSYKKDYAVPLILLDAELPQNSERKKTLTEQLYRSDDSWIKLMQRALLGFGGVASLEELGYNIDIFHLNEGHAAFAFIEKARGLSDNQIEALKGKFYYTCHTPVQAGHDRFSEYDVQQALIEEDAQLISKFGTERPGLINLTLLSMNIASSINAVSKRHQEVMQLQFPEYKDRIRYVTNGVHPYTWISDNFLDCYKKFDSVIHNIEANPMALLKARSLKGNQDFRSQIWQAHQKNKLKLCTLLNKWQLKEDVFTICWARRIAAYKRPSLILEDAQRLMQIAKKVGPLQIILAGKAHPNDNLAFTFINELLDKIDSLKDNYDLLKIILLENYDIYLGKLLTSSVDLWLNNPYPPFEASGTSGMKALLNGVVQMSTLDGWVVEAEDMGIGKIFGYRYVEGKLGAEFDSQMKNDAEELYSSLEEIAGKYYSTFKNGDLNVSSGWIDMMIDCIAAGSHFNTYRMLDEYKDSIWEIKKKKESIIRV